jgi:hypothetical protein
MVKQAGIGEGEPESGDEEDGPPDQLRPDADDGAGASGVGEGIGLDLDGGITSGIGPD